MADKGKSSKSCEELFKWLEENSCDLRCESNPSGGGDYTILWVVVEHYMEEPKERKIGYGKRPQEAIKDAMKDKNDPTKWEYLPASIRE